MEPELDRLLRDVRWRFHQITEAVGNATEQSCTGASFLEDHIDPDYGLLDTLKICELPFEILDLILSKFVLLQMYFKRQADRCIFMNLASVNGLWSEIIKRRHFKIAVAHLLAVYFRKVKKRTTIIDHNYKFLKDVLQPDILIDQLDITGCLKQKQIKKLKRIRKVKDKNDELLFLLRNLNSQNYSQFVQCLCATDQNNAARVLEHGGETVKVHITNRDDFQTTELENSLTTKLIEEPKEYDRDWNRINLPYEQRLDGVSVLHAKQDHGITIWLWFTTEDAWNKVKANSEDIILKIIQKLFQRLMPKSTIESHNVQLQYINLNNGFAIRKLIVQSKRWFQVKGDAEHVAVLMDKIYVTQKRSILVYENKDPYPQLPEIRLPEATTVYKYEVPYPQLKELRLQEAISDDENEIPYPQLEELPLPEAEPVEPNPLQIAVCQMHNCLYAAVKDAECIYKIEPMYNHRITLWLNEAGSSLVVVTTCSGDVLVLRRETGAYSLRVFNNDGVLLHDMSVSNDLYNRVVSVQEITPNVIATNYSNHGGGQSYYISALFKIHLNRLELIDRKRTLGMAINCLVPFSSCQLLVEVGHDYDEEEQYRLGLYDFHFWSIEIQNILHEKTVLVGIYFSLDQKELFVLSSKKTISIRESLKQIIERFNDMLKESNSFFNMRRHHTEMKRCLNDMEMNSKIEIYKMNYEDDDYD